MQTDALNFVFVYCQYLSGIAIHITWQSTTPNGVMDWAVNLAAPRINDISAKKTSVESGSFIQADPFAEVMCSA